MFEEKKKEKSLRLSIWWPVPERCQSHILCICIQVHAFFSFITCVAFYKTLTYLYLTLFTSRKRFAHTAPRWANHVILDFLIPEYIFANFRFSTAWHFAAHTNASVQQINPFERPLLLRVEIFSIHPHFWQAERKSKLRTRTPFSPSHLSSCSATHTHASLLLSNCKIKQ